MKVNPFWIRNPNGRRISLIKKSLNEKGEQVWPSPLLELAPLLTYKRRWPATKRKESKIVKTPLHQAVLSLLPLLSHPPPSPLSWVRFPKPHLPSSYWRVVLHLLPPRQIASRSMQEERVFFFLRWPACFLVFLLHLARKKGSYLKVSSSILGERYMWCSSFI